MANQEHIAILKQGVETWNQWRKEHRDIQPDLSRINLSGLYLGEADFSLTDFRLANLSEANLSGADLSIANLSEANLSGATLQGADFSRANLSSADLSGADLYKADLGEANLHKADLSGAVLSSTNLREADLSSANLTQAKLYEANLTQANLSGANLTQANLSFADLPRTNLSFADLSGAILIGAGLVETDCTKAILTNCNIYGIAAWNVELEGAKQESLVITRKGEPTIKVDNLEVAQFIYLLLNYKKLRDILNAVTERGVLILGRFGGGGLDVLHAIADWLREASYLPIIFDFERSQDRNYTETVETLAGLARFVIVDLSGPSVPQELEATVPQFKIPFIPIIEAGRKAYSTAVDIFEYPWVVSPPVTFATIEELLEQMPTKVIAPAEERHKARQKVLDELFKKA